MLMRVGARSVGERKRVEREAAPGLDASRTEAQPEAKVDLLDVLLATALLTRFPVRFHRVSALRSSVHGRLCCEADWLAERSSYPRIRAWELHPLQTPWST
jgi:hypothetical protein